MVGTASILIIMSAAQPFSWVLTYELAPQKVLALVENANLAQWELYLLINIAMLILGCFMEAISVMLLTIPIFMPLVAKVGIDPVHFGLIVTINLGIGQQTPPVASVLLREENNLTLAVGSKYYLYEQKYLWGDFAAAAVLSGLPITLVFLAAQRWIVSGLTAGGVKG